jgi:hypothetical protein
MLAITKKNYNFTGTDFSKIFNRFFVFFYPGLLSFNFINIPVLNINNNQISILNFEYSKDVVFLLIIISFSLFAIVKVNFPLYINFIFRSILRFGGPTKKSTTNYQPFLLTNIVFVLNSSFIFLLITDFFQIKILYINPIAKFFLILVSFSIFYLIKNILYRLISALFLHKEYVTDFLNNTYIFNQFTGIILLPFVVGIPFIGNMGSKLLIYTAMVLVLVILFMRYINGIKILVRKGISVFYLILYLCVLEIIPYFIVYKLALNYI